MYRKRFNLRKLEAVKFRIFRNKRARVSIVVYVRALICARDKYDNGGAVSVVSD